MFDFSERFRESIMLYMDMLLDIVCLQKILNMQDGFKDDSLRMMKDIERSNAQCQVCLNNVSLTYFQLSVRTVP